MHLNVSKRPDRRQHLNSTAKQFGNKPALWELAYKLNKKLRQLVKKWLLQMDKVFPQKLGAALRDVCSAHQLCGRDDARSTAPLLYHLDGRLGECCRGDLAPQVHLWCKKSANPLSWRGVLAKSSNELAVLANTTVAPQSCLSSRGILESLLVLSALRL